MKWVNISGGGANSVTKGNFAGDIKLKEGPENNEKNGNVGKKFPQLKNRASVLRGEPQLQNRKLMQHIRD